MSPGEPDSPRSAAARSEPDRRPHRSAGARALCSLLSPGANNHRLVIPRILLCLYSWSVVWGRGRFVRLNVGTTAVTASPVLCHPVSRTRVRNECCIDVPSLCTGCLPALRSAVHGTSHLSVGCCMPAPPLDTHTQPQACSAAGSEPPTPLGGRASLATLQQPTQGLPEITES